MKNTQRFSNRVQDYARYRPGYPDGVIKYLQNTHGITNQKVIADIGAGTGISASLFLSEGYPVIAVEPNGPMREKAEQLFGDNPNFRSQAGSAENTGLESGSVDAIVCFQAFHWFDRGKARTEFDRILKPDGLVALVWNERRVRTPFEQEYEKLILKYAIDYVQVDHRQIGPDDLREFFRPGTYSEINFPNKQSFDLKGLMGRLASSSYIPPPGSDGYKAMTTDLKTLFEKHHLNGIIDINYITRVYTGKL